MTLSSLFDLRSCTRLVALAIAVSLAVGCSGTVQDKVMTGAAQAPNPLGEAKALVQRYADGGELGSEAMNFDDVIQRATAADAGKGAKIKKFLDDTRKKGVDASAAKALLNDL